MTSKIRQEDILRIRLTLGLTQREIAKTLRVSQGAIDSLEKHRLRLSSKLESKFKELVKDVKLINKNLIIQKKEEFKNRGRFYGERAKSMAKKGGRKGAITIITQRKPTKQERMSIDLLNSNHIKFDFNAPVFVENRTFIVDFAIPSKDNPEKIIEVKELKGKYRKYLTCVELAWRIIKLKDKYLNSRFYVWVSGDLIDSEISIVSSETTRFF